MKAVLSHFWINFLFIFLICGLAQYCNAQPARKNDVLIKRDSSKVEVLIQEISESQVKYKKISDLEGPLFTILKKEIATIIYGNGEVENFPAPIEQYFEEVTVAPVVPYKEEKPEVKRPGNSAQLEANYKLYARKAATYKTMGIIGGAVGVLFTVVGIVTVSDAVRSYNNSQISSYSYQNRVAGGTLLTMTGLGAGIPLTIIGLVKRKSYTKKALRVQEQLRARKDLSFHSGYNPSAQVIHLGVKLAF